MIKQQQQVKRESIPTISAYLHWGCSQKVLKIAPSPTTLLDMGGNGRMACFVDCPVTNANIINGIDGTALPYEKDSFDVCTSVAVLEHVSDWKAFLSESVRVGKRGAVHWFPLGAVAREIELYKDSVGHVHQCEIYEVADVEAYSRQICSNYELIPFMNVGEQLLLLATINQKVDNNETYRVVHEKGQMEYGYLLSMVP